uniref:Villin-1-like n=1 Tax=Phallusia mammillata TaxID=59560 RepID=A0A6F9DWR6_9ASCI|nr:villin-1-like [Phallusia mammillata]
MRLEGTTECRVELGKEPSHFIALFGGKFIIMKGNDPLSSQKKPLPPTNTGKVPGVFLYIVKGTNELNTKVIQVPCRASSLNCNYPFICSTPSSVYLWFGKGCIGDQRSMAHMMADLMLTNKNLVVFEEGSESSRFFTALGGKKPYLNLVMPKDPETTRYIKTYQCGVDRRGEFVFSEAYDLVQKDLDPNSVILIDTHDEILMWLGTHVETHIAVQCFQMAFAYLKTTKDRSDMKTAVAVVKQDHEPEMFTRLFPSWDPSLTMDDSENRVTAESVKRLLVNRYGLPTFTREELSEGCPDGVDPAKKEKYLSEQEFLAVFRMTREDFAKKSEWTRTDLKKKHKLF